MLTTAVDHTPATRAGARQRDMSEARPVCGVTSPSSTRAMTLAIGASTPTFVA
jgi:hypothetical protein